MTSLRRSPAAGSTRLIVAVVVVAAGAVAAYVLFRPTPPPPRPITITVPSDEMSAPAYMPDRGPLVVDRAADAAPLAFDAKAFDHVLAAVAGGALPRGGDVMTVAAAAALDAKTGPGRLVELTGTVAKLEAEKFASEAGPRWTQLWAFALDDAGARVVVVQPGEANALDGGRPAPTRIGATPRPLKDGDRVRVRGVVAQQRTGTVGIVALDGPTWIVVGREYRLVGSVFPPPPALGNVQWESVRDRFLAETRDVADDAHWATLAWAKARGHRAIAGDLASGALPVATWGMREFQRWRHELESDRVATAVDPRQFTLDAHGRVFTFRGYLADVVAEDWDRVPENPYGVDRRFSYWVLLNEYGNVVVPMHCAFPPSAFSTVPERRPNTTVPVRVWGVFMRNYSFTPSAGPGEITVPAYQLLHMEPDRP